MYKKKAGESDRFSKLQEKFGAVGHFEMCNFSPKKGILSQKKSIPSVRKRGAWNRPYLSQGGLAKISSQPPPPQLTNGRMFQTPNGFNYERYPYKRDVPSTPNTPFFVPLGQPREKQFHSVSFLEDPKGKGQSWRVCF